MPVRGPGGKPPPSTLQERFAELTARNYLELKEHTRHDYSPVPSPSAATGQQPLPNVGTTPLPPLPPLPPSLPPLSSLLLLPSLPSLPQPPLTAMMVAAAKVAAAAKVKAAVAAEAAEAAEAAAAAQVAAAAEEAAAEEAAAEEAAAEAAQVAASSATPGSVVSIAAATSVISIALPSPHTLMTLVNKAAYVRSQLGLDEGMTLPQQDSDLSILPLSLHIHSHPFIRLTPPSFLTGNRCGADVGRRDRRQAADRPV